jgi:hypothetical protein
MHVNKSSMRRVVATMAAAVLVSGAVEAVTAGAASARPRGPNSCSVYNQAINESQISTTYAEYYYGQFQADVATGDDAQAEADSNEFRNWDDNSARWLEIADANPC